MCDKRPACPVSGPFKKFENDAVESPTGSSINCNEIIHPVAEYQSLFNNIEPTSVKYDGKFPLQLEEFLFYSLTTLAPSKKLSSVKAEEYVNASKAFYVMFGVRFDYQSIRNYFHLSLNNVTKGLGKYDGYLRFILKVFKKLLQTVNVCQLTCLRQTSVTPVQRNTTNFTVYYSE